MTIVPYEDKKKLLIRRPHDKVVERDVSNNVVAIPFGTRSYNLSEINKKQEQIIKEQSEKIEEYEREQSGNARAQQIDHYKYNLEKYLIHCFRNNKDIQLVQCLNHQRENKCAEKCIIFSDYFRRYGLNIRVT